jgi:hypothetical protein
VAAPSYSERVDVPGVRPAAFKLVEWAPESFHLFRSSRKIGGAAKEDRGFSARFKYESKDWRASAGDAADLLKLVGTFILAQDARAAAAAGTGADDKKGVKRRITKDEQISLDFLKRAQALRLADLDHLIATCRKRVTPA